jgi:hypothetical protein
VYRYWYYCGYVSDRVAVVKKKSALENRWLVRDWIVERPVFGISKHYWDSLRVVGKES